tara:strand:- start:4088 stop:4834 length:747 start_codon:yes stop_codon:yes gene_type:complete
MSKKCIACNLCGKKYVRPGSLKRHLNVCEIIHNSKRTNDINRKEMNNIPTRFEMYTLIEDLVKNQKVLQNKVSNLENKLNKRKNGKKINVIDWLNSNCNKATPFKTWINNMKIEENDLKNLFKKDFKTSVECIIINNIEIGNSTFKSFKQKKNVLYVKKEEWQTLTFNEFYDRIVNHIQRKLICLFLDWSESLKEKEKTGSNNEVYLKYQSKIFGGNNIEKTVKSIYKDICQKRYEDIYELINNKIVF